MRYKIEIVPGAERQFRKIPSIIQGRITPKILSLENNPRPFGNQKLRNTSYYRLRIGDYRIIYAVNDDARMVKILDIGHRREVYR